MLHAYVRWIFAGILMLGLTTGCVTNPALQDNPTPTGVSEPQVSEPYRIFVVYSYGILDEWNRQLEDGLLEAFNHLGYGHQKSFTSLQTYPLNVDESTTQELLEAKIANVVSLIEATDPHVVIVADEIAAEALIPNYPDPTQTFVFCGISDANLAYYGLAGNHVVGVVERPFPVETARLAKSFIPRASRILLLGDEGSIGDTGLDHLANNLREAEDLEIEEVLVRQTSSWMEWRQSVLEYSPKVDFVMLAKHDGVRGDDGMLVNSAEVLEWTLRRSPRPVFALWLPAVQQGAVGGLTVSPYEQGWTAAELTVQILEGNPPSTLPIRPPKKNELAINIAGGEYWGMQIPLTFLTTANVYKKFPTP